MGCLILAGWAQAIWGGGHGQRGAEGLRARRGGLRGKRRAAEDQPEIPAGEVILISADLGIFQVYDLCAIL